MLAAGAAWQEDMASRAAPSRPARRRATPAVAVATAAATASSFLPAAAAQASVPPGCFFYGWRFEPEMKNLTSNPVTGVESAVDCQKICRQTPGCKYFGWATESKACWLADYTMKTFLQDPRFVAGLSDCEGPSVLCTALPGPGFPGKTAEESDHAWPTGLVPPRLQCWPRNESGAFVSCGQELTVLDDTANGWPGKCFGLEEARSAGAECEEQCRVTESCSVWQEVVYDDNTTHCWQGWGQDCFATGRKASIRAAQRVMRGSFRVLLDLKGRELTVGMRKVFEPLPGNMRGFGQSQEEAVSQCNHTCLSLPECEAWQYSTQEGCRVNDPSVKVLPYPITTEFVRNDTKLASSMIAGAFVQRLCLTPPPKVSAVAVEDRSFGFQSSLSTTQATGTKTSSTTMSSTITLSTSRTTLSTTTPSPTETESTSTQTTSTQTTETTLTSIKPVPASRGLPDLFVSGADQREIYFRDGESATKHLVRMNSCSRCSEGIQRMCKAPMQVTEGELLGLPDGEDFECNMFKEGAVRPVEDTIDVVQRRTISKTSTTETTTTMTTMDENATIIVGAPTEHVGAPTVHHAQQFSLPWWVWLLIVLLFAAALGYAVYFCIHRRRRTGILPSRKRATSLQKQSSGSDYSDAMKASFDSEASDPLMAAPQVGNMSPPGTYQALGPQMGHPLQQGTMSGQQMDLVTVTPQGLAVTPLNGSAPPPGVPVLHDFPTVGNLSPPYPGTQPGYGSPQVPNSPMMPQTPPPPMGPSQNMDLVTVTPQGLAVTPLNGNPPPAGVPFLNPNSGGYPQMPMGFATPQLPTGSFPGVPLHGGMAWTPHVQ